MIIQEAMIKVAASKLSRSSKIGDKKVSEENFQAADTLNENKVNLVPSKKYPRKIAKFVPPHVVSRKKSDEDIALLKAVKYFKSKHIKSGDIESKGKSSSVIKHSSVF